MSRSNLNFFARTFTVAIAASATAFVFAGNETVFPKNSKILRVERPAQCKEWAAPLPDRRTDVAFPDDARGIKGDAALLVRIGANGEYIGVTDYLASDEAYAKAAEMAVKNWTFKPARCNGEAIASDARVDFEFRREGGITYTSGTALGRK